MRPTLLTTAAITAILPVIDMRRACDFYENKLGLLPLGLKPNGQFLFGGGNGAQIGLYLKAEGTKADHTAISFKVADIQETLITLESRGVQFEDYDLPGLKTVNHICTMEGEKAAWFKDTEGNYLCIHQESAAWPQ